MTGWGCDVCGGINPVGTRFCGHCGRPAPAEPTAIPESVVLGRVGDRLSEFGDRPGYERRLVTALFADVSGFTSLADRLDPEELLEVIDPVIAALGAVVKKYEGYIEKFAGDALLALYGAPVAHEDDAVRAVLTAIEMHRELQRVAVELPHEADLSLHVGVNSGHGIGRILESSARTDYAVLGDCVILAQRLESAAPRGETYVSALTVELTSDQFEFEPVGELTLKGKSEPVAAWRLAGERRRRAGPWQRAQRLVGRDAELATLRGVFSSLADGSGAVVSVTGDPGVGKSRLAREARAESRHARWLVGRCLPYGADLAYWPYAQLIRDFAAVRPEDAPELAAEEVKAAFADVPLAVPFVLRLLGLPVASGDDVARLEPEEFHRRLHGVIGAWLTALAAERPTVVVLEDVHWADRSTLELTASLRGLTATVPLVLYVIGRPEARPLLAEISAEALVVELAPLSERQVEQFLESILGGSPPRTLARTVCAHTGGNPFFVEELVKSMQETGALEQLNGMWRLRPGWEPGDLPLNVEGVLAARIDLLPVDMAMVLQSASVIGRRVRLPLLQAIERDVARVDAAVDSLVHAGFLDPLDEDGETGLVFHHALVQDVAYSKLLRRSRRELHLRVAEVAERLYGDGDDTIDLLARHLYLGKAGPGAVPYLARAGARAKALFANDAAIVHFARAAELDPDNTDVRLELGDLHELVGSYDEALRHYDWVRERAGDVRAWSGAAAVLRKTGEYDDAVSLVNAAFGSSPLRNQDLTPLWLENGWTLSLLGQYDRALEVFAAGLDAAEARRDPNVARLLVQLARSEGFMGRYEDGLQHALEAVEICEAHDDPRALAVALRVAGGAYSYVHRFDDADTTLRRALLLAERVGSIEEIGACLGNLCMNERARGSYEAATAWARRAADEFDRAGLASQRAQGYANLACVLEESEHLDEALTYGRRALALADEIGFRLGVADSTNTLACIELKRGNFAGAAELAEQAARVYAEFNAPPREREMLALAAEAWESAGDAERARACSTRALELSSV